METRNIKDFIHLYLGCEMEYKTHHEPQDATYTLDGKSLDQAIEFGERPILRPLSSMTEEEAAVLCTMSVNGLRAGDKVTIVEFDMFYSRCKFYIHHDDDPETKVHRFLEFNKWKPEQTVFMLSKDFDIFGLIESGLAIDKTKTHE